MAPKPTTELKTPGRKGGTASSKEKALCDPTLSGGRKAVLAGRADEASNQADGLETSRSTGVSIKQEPSFGIADIPLAPTSNMEKTCDTESNTPAATKSAHHPGPDPPTTNIKANAKVAKKGPNGGKRKGGSSGNEGPPSKKKPRDYRKPRNITLEAAKYVSHANTLVLSGKNAKLPQDIDLDLPTICQAPTEVREHLKSLEKAGLSLAHAAPETIKTHVKVLSGLCHVFKQLKPWLVDRDGEPRVDDFKWKIHGLIHPLHSHQMLGSAIMIVIERDENQCSGLLLDFMGFGKTIQTLACVVSNRVRSKKAQSLPQGSTTTLVVVRKSAATQWVDEVKRHTKPQLSVMLWTRQTEITRDETLAADILVVTYDQARSMHKVCKTSKAKSLLFDVCYQRIVLDEAHKIKNRKSEIFAACMSLQGKHRWALTGTPIPNGVHELWPLLKFTQHPDVNSFTDFKQKYLTKKRGAKSKGAAEYVELSKILLPISIMRTPGHQFCGIPLVNLPQDHAITEVVPLGAEEKVILEYLEEYVMNYITVKCGGKSNYFCLMERFLRYRQFSASPLLLEGPVKDRLWTIDQVRLMKEEARNTGAEETPIIDLFERWILEPKRDHLAPTGNRKMDSMLAKADPVICPLCSRPQADPLLADCGHVWCKECVTKWQRACSLMNEEISCPKCKRLIGEVRPYDPEESSDDDQDAMRCRKGVDHNGFQPADDDGSTLFQFLDQHPEAPIPMSAKMKRMLDLILEWQTKAREDKIIVFFRFIGISRILGRLLQDHGIGYLYFVGQMNSDQRRDARIAFEENPEIKVLMVSITTGGEALNLTMANRCIIYEPWWHGAVEEQAFGRVNRIGQQKETHCVRLFAEGTIDVRMNDLQKEKKEQQSAIAELEAGKGLTAKTLRRILEGRMKKEGGSDSSDADSVSEDSGEDDEYGDSDSEYEDPNDRDWGS